MTGPVCVLGCFCGLPCRAVGVSVWCQCHCLRCLDACTWPWSASHFLWSVSLFWVHADLHRVFACNNLEMALHSRLGKVAGQALPAVQELSS